MLNVIGVFSPWFATQPLNEPPPTNLLLSALDYIFPALEDPNLCLHAANTLKNRCNANRKALAPHITLESCMLEWIIYLTLRRINSYSRLRALQSDEEITPIEAIIQPIIQKLATALQSSVELPDQVLRESTKMFLADDDPAVKQELEKIQNDLRMIKSGTIYTASSGASWTFGQLTLALVMRVNIHRRNKPKHELTSFSGP
ncbi:hypothetical protein JOM56_011616 [Amanita muscaria]